MNRRKLVLKETSQYIYDRIAKSLPLPPTMQRGTKEYVKSKYWTTLNQRCANGAYRVNSEKNESYRRKGINLLITKSQFGEWVDVNWEKFKALYESGRTPSIDRIDNSFGYSIENMEVVDLKENMRKDRIKPIIGTSILDGSKIFFECAKDASNNGFDANLISRSCRTEMSHKGYRWKFRDQKEAIA